MQKIIEKLNKEVKGEKIIEKDEDKLDQKVSGIKYLEEVVLKNSDVKYSDIEPLLSAGKNNSASKGDENHKRQLFP